MRLTTAKQLSIALASLLPVATYPENADDNARARFWADTEQAEELLADGCSRDEGDHERLLHLAGAVRAVRKWVQWNDDQAPSARTEFDRIASEADAALAQFDRCPLSLHTHYQTQIERDGEPFDVIALTTCDEQTYVASGRPGEILAYVPAESLVGIELASRLAKAAGAPVYGDGLQVGNALRAAKALIEALADGKSRTQADMYDVLSNFEGLTL